jgi:hypothetical protein
MPVVGGEWGQRPGRRGCLNTARRRAHRSSCAQHGEQSSALPEPSPTSPLAARPNSQQASTPVAARSAASASTPTSASAVEPRTELLKRANAAYAGKDLSRAQTLYGRVITASPSPSESAVQTHALTGFAEFRLLLTLIGRGSEQDAQQLVQRLRSANADSPFTRLASDFWDQYGMTASVAAACAAISSEVAGQASSAMAELQRLGAGTSPRELCVAPGA